MGKRNRAAAKVLRDDRKAEARTPEARNERFRQRYEAMQPKMAFSVYELARRKKAMK